MEKQITSKELLAFLHCQRKAHLLLHSDIKGTVNEYVGKRAKIRGLWAPGSNK